MQAAAIEALVHPTKYRTKGPKARKPPSPAFRRASVEHGLAPAALELPENVASYPGAVEDHARKHSLTVEDASKRYSGSGAAQYEDEMAALASPHLSPSPHSPRLSPRATTTPSPGIPSGDDAEDTSVSLTSERLKLLQFSSTGVVEQVPSPAGVGVEQVNEEPKPIDHAQPIDAATTSPSVGERDQREEVPVVQEPEDRERSSVPSVHVDVQEVPASDDSASLTESSRHSHTSGLVEEHNSLSHTTSAPSVVSPSKPDEKEDGQMDAESSSPRLRADSGLPRTRTYSGLQRRANVKKTRRSRPGSRNSAGSPGRSPELGVAESSSSNTLADSNSATESAASQDSVPSSGSHRRVSDRQARARALAVVNQRRAEEAGELGRDEAAESRSEGASSQLITRDRSRRITGQRPRTRSSQTTSDEQDGGQRALVRKYVHICSLLRVCL